MIHECENCDFLTTEEPMAVEHAGQTDHIIRDRFLVVNK
jgi:hypothetical protein